MNRSFRVTTLMVTAIFVGLLGLVLRAQAQNRLALSKSPHPQIAAAGPAQLASSCLNEEWVARYSEPGASYDYAKDVAVDGDGYVYVTGVINASGLSDYLTVKYNAAGVQQWTARYDGPGNSYDGATRITVDGSGNVYVTGSSYNASGNADYATIKYDAAGVEQWVTRYDGPANGADGAVALALDASGNVYVTGNSPNSDGNKDYATIKYDADGVQQWAMPYDGPDNLNDIVSGLAVDGSGNVYVTGRSSNSDGNTDYATVKYNAAGVQQWEARYNSLDELDDYPAGLAVDGSGNVYVTGTSANSGGGWDYATLKYDASGAQLWERRYAGPANGSKEARVLVLDASANVYVTGDSYTGVDFDYATVKYNDAGVEQWAALYNGPANSTDAAYDLAADGSGNVYVTGYSYDAAGYSDYATVKYDAAGVEQCVVRYDAANDDDDAEALAIDGSGNVYVTGRSRTPDVDYATVKYSPPPNTPDGTNVTVSPQDATTNTTPVTLTFDQVTMEGNTALTTGSSGPPPPTGFMLGTPPAYYDLTTTAEFTGNIEVCLDYTGTAFTDESALTFQHFEGGAWVDVTSSHDPVNNIICGKVTSLSPFAIFAPTAITVTVDINPGVTPNIINLKNNGTVPVAILTTATFDATTVDPLSVKFGPNGATEIHQKGHIQDVDNDGDLDLVLHFKTRETGIACGQNEASLNGQTFGGQAVAGTDAIQTVGCSSGKALADEDAGIPAEYALWQNYPNPFNPETEITFALPNPGYVRLRIYSVTGQLVATLVDGEIAVGRHRILWNGLDQNNHEIAAGVYLYRLAAIGLSGETMFTQTKRMTVLK